MAINSKLKDHILESIGEGVFTVDKDFRINFFNRAAEEITGYKKDEVEGKFCKHIFKSKLCYSDCPIALVLKTNKNIYDHESSILTSQQTKRPIRLNAAVLYNEENEPTGGIITFRDMTELASMKHDIENENQYYGVIGKSKSMREIFELISEISDSSAPVLIRGESGTGKEMIANAIQKTSFRSDKPFIKINCSVLPPQLLASELFGHIKGAFTDAVKDRIGRFEMANGGTIFLDEVAEMPQQTQLQLLRVLQEGTFERVGESDTRKTDVRVIAATNIDVDKSLNNGKFREDLYYRLNVIPIDVLPLRERKIDIIPLSKYFLDKLNLVYKKDIKEISSEAFDILNSYKWPGNVRELENVIEYAYVRTKTGSIISPSKLPNLDTTPEKISQFETTPIKSNFHNLLELLEKHKWNKSAVAKELGIGRTTLWRKLKKLGIES